MQSKAATVAEYLAELPPDRRKAIEAVRKVIRQNLDKEYEEGMQYGMIGYYVPHRVYPAGYHCDPKQPLPFAGLASQKNHLAVYLMCIYSGTDHDRWFRAAWAKAGKKLDMGKCCVRFKRLEDVALEVIGESIARVSARQYIAIYEAAIGARKSTEAKTLLAKKKVKPTSNSRAAAKKKANTVSPVKRAKASRPKRGA